MTVARDELDNLPRLADALSRQTVRPVEWLILDNGSKDGTAELIEDLDRRYGWVKSLYVETRATPVRGANVAKLTSVAMAAVAPARLVAIVNADVSFPRDHFELLCRLFADRPRLGVASGAREEYVSGRWRVRRLTGINVEAQCRVYQRQCLEKLLPFETHAGWDGVDVVRAHVDGWETHVEEIVRFRHHRPIGARDGSRLRGWMNEGKAAWAMGYRPSYLAFRVVYKCVEDPRAVGLLLGYLRARFTAERRCEDATIRNHIRNEQRLRALAQRVREVRSRSTARGRLDVLLVAEPGGHLAELWSLRDAWRGLASAWFTLRSEHSESLLRDQETVFGSGPTTRSLVKLVLNVGIAFLQLLRMRPKVLLVSGSGLVVPVVWIGRLLGARVLFLECGGRVDGPSLSLRLSAPVAERVYVQSQTLARAHPRARYRGRVPWGSTLAAYHLAAAEAGTFVTVGSSRKYPFDRLLSALDNIDAPKPIVVQRGISSMAPIGASTFSFAPLPTIEACMARAKVVVGHAGIGTVMMAAALGKHLIVMPRLQNAGECVDDHQLSFARDLTGEVAITIVQDAAELERAVRRVAEQPPPSLASDSSRLVNELREYLVATTRGAADARRIATPSAHERPAAVEPDGSSTGHASERRRLK